MTCTGVAPACATYQTPSRGWLNGAREVTHMPPRASNVTLVAYGIPAATSCPGAAIDAARAPAAQSMTQSTAKAARVRRTRRAYPREGSGGERGRSGPQLVRLALRGSAAPLRAPHLRSRCG